MRGRPRKYNDFAAEVVGLHSIGHTVREITGILGIPRATVHRIIRRHDTELTPTTIHGS